MDSLCLTWLEHDKRYLITYLPRDGGELEKHYVNNIEEFIELLRTIEVLVNVK